ncbi:hypothetical protein [Candidatus Erwinia dacicola]|nr:hypothetical protein [Candidatus Erwinia dacicola]RAP72097.1 hypothetical protein ACZ87_01080 [Candidatus Erwinia dacicola]
MKTEMVIGLSLFAVLTLYSIQFLIRQRSIKVKQQRINTLAEYNILCEEVELKARRKL